MLMRSRFGFAAAAMTILARALPPMAPGFFLQPHITSMRQRLPRAPRVIERRAPRLNRSRHWPFAETYKDARRISPVPLSPVR
jgi:hypothetical protein